MNSKLKAETEAIESKSEDDPKNLLQNGDTNGSTQETNESETVDGMSALMKLGTWLTVKRCLRDHRQASTRA